MNKTSAIQPADLQKALRYDADSGKLYWRFRDGLPALWNAKHAGKEAFTYRHAEGYYVGTFLRTSLKAHRVAWAIVHGRWPREIDHIDGDRGNNRLANLREVTPSQNSKNRGQRSDNTSGVTGVSWDNRSQKWLVQIVVNGRNTRIGHFVSLSAAAKARREAERKFGYHSNHGRRREQNGTRTGLCESPV